MVIQCKALILSSGQITRVPDKAEALQSNRYEPYTCRDRECTERRQKGKRCPWCWGGFPGKAVK